MYIYIYIYPSIPDQAGLSTPKEALENRSVKKNTYSPSICMHLHG